MKMEVIWEKDNWEHRETIAIWDEHAYNWMINPGRVPTKIEMETCPQVFVCFSCLEKHPQKELGGRYYEQWFCKFCIPFVDGWTAGAMVWWDEKRRKRHCGKPPKMVKPLTKVERETQIRSAVVWCVMNGYPVKPIEGGQDND